MRFLIFFLLIVTLTLADLMVEHCGPGSWTAFKDSCLLVNIERGLTKRLAQNYCQQQNASLVKLKDPGSMEKYQVIQEIAKQVVYTWIDGERAGNNQTYFWSDGTQVSHNSTWWCTNANVTEQNMNCLEYSSERKCIHNYYCDATNVYPICEKAMQHNNSYRLPAMNTLLLLLLQLALSCLFQH